MTLHESRRSLIERCAMNPQAPMYRDLDGIEFCCRCGYTKALHEAAVARRKKEATRWIPQ